MRNFPLLLVLLLLSLLTAAASAASAHALSLPVVPAVAEEEDEGGEEPEEEEEEAEGPEDPLIAELTACEGRADEERCEERVVQEAEAEECLLEDARASVRASPRSGKVRLTVRYRSLEPTTVDLDVKLRGGKGSLHLGSDRARIGRSGAIHDTFSLGKRQLAKALAARQFTIYLHAAGTPGDCATQLTASRAGARKLRWD